MPSGACVGTLGARIGCSQSSTSVETSFRSPIAQRILLDEVGDAGAVALDDAREVVADEMPHAVGAIPPRHSQ